MSEKPYEWSEGAKLGDHSHRKHKIVRQYFADYLHVRCQHPLQSKFRLAVVDGFAGGGRYAGGTAGSPIIFVEELDRAIEIQNVTRAASGMAALDIEALLVLNDMDLNAIEALKANLAPLEAEIKSTRPKLHLRFEFLNQAFETAYPSIKKLSRTDNITMWSSTSISVAILTSPLQP